MASRSYIRSIVIVNIFALNVGVYIGWTPWLIRSLEQSYTGVTVDEITWVASVPEIGDLIGGFIVFFVGNHTGRKSMLLCASLPLTVGWTALLFSKTLLVIYSTRIIMGIGMGMCYSLLPMYFSEIALVNHRGLITSSQTLSVELGMLSMYTYCAFVSLNDMPVFPIALLVISDLLFLTVPESPHYLAFRKDYEGVKKSLKQLHGDFQEKEMQLIVKHVNDHATKSGRMDLFLVPRNRKIFLVITSIVVTSQFGGNVVTTTYINDILISLGKELSMPYVQFFLSRATASYFMSVLYQTFITGTVKRRPRLVARYLNIVIGLVVCVGALCNMLLLDYLGRKSIFLSSIVGGGIASAAIAVCSFLREKNYHADVAGNVGMAGIVLLTFMGSFGYMSVLRVLVSEVFATNVRTFAVAYVSCLTTICIFIAVKVFGIIVKRFGAYATFSVFVGFSIVTVSLAIFFLPETKRKSFDEIQNGLARESSLPSWQEGKETSENYSTQ